MGGVDSVDNTAFMDVLSDYERYAEFTDLVCDDGAAFDAFWADFSDEHSGYTVDFLYKKVEPPEGFLSRGGFVLLESSVETRCGRDDFRPCQSPPPTVVTAENFGLFAARFDDEGMYWNVGRVEADLSRWFIAVAGEGGYVLSLDGAGADVYALRGGVEECRALLTAAVRRAFESGGDEVSFFVNDERDPSGGEPSQMAAALDLGFRVCGRCLTYRAVVE